jgi:hypothetical protein
MFVYLISKLFNILSITTKLVNISEYDIKQFVERQF